jgi:hypothetical protein
LLSHLYSRYVAKNFQPLFVGGSGRSGTTIAINLLNRHSEVHSSMPREIKYLTSRSGLIDLVYGRPVGLEESPEGIRNNLVARALPIIGKSKIKLFQTNMRGAWWSEVGKKGKERGLVQGITKQSLDAALDGFIAEFKGQPLESARKLFYELSNQQIKRSEVKYFADSTPVNIMQANYLHQLFPEALYLNMVRDGRDVAYSVAHERWGPSDPHTALDWWANRVLKAEQALVSVPANQRVTLRLEDLVVRDRENSLKIILGLLGINPEEKLKAFFDLELTEEKLNQGKWKKELENPSNFEKKYLKILDKLKDQGVVVERFY